MIDEQNKTAVIRLKGFEGADQLLNLVHGYLEGGDQADRLDTVLRLFESEEILRDVMKKIKDRVKTERDFSVLYVISSISLIVWRCCHFPLCFRIGECKVGGIAKLEIYINRFLIIWSIIYI